MMQPSAVGPVHSAVGPGVAQCARELERGCPHARGHAPLRPSHEESVPTIVQTPILTIAQQTAKTTP